MRAARFPWSQKIHSRSPIGCRFGKVSKKRPFSGMAGTFQREHLLVAGRKSWSVGALS
jgi:hypothetical protein